jgi:alcohol dehydrogenase (cytochrome c)
MLAQASRNGYYFLIDRATGENLVSAEFGAQNWSVRLNSRGEPVAKPEKEPQIAGTLFEGSGTNWWSPSYSPDTGLFYVNAHHHYMVSYLTLDDQNEEKASDHQGGANAALWSESMLLALDYQTGKVRWRRDRPNADGREAAGQGTGILTTAGGLLFTGDSTGDLVALDASNGKTLWHTYPGGNVTGSPMTYEWAGRQYVITAVEGVLYAWALPEH